MSFLPILLYRAHHHENFETALVGRIGEQLIETAKWLNPPIYHQRNRCRRSLSFSRLHNCHSRNFRHFFGWLRLKNSIISLNYFTFITFSISGLTWIGRVVANDQWPIEVNTCSPRDRNLARVFVASAKYFVEIPPIKSTFGGRRTSVPSPVTVFKASLGISLIFSSSSEWAPKYYRLQIHLSARELTHRGNRV